MRSQGILVLAVLMGGAVGRASPTAYLEKVETTPDLTQTSPTHCGPFAVSNSLVWLARRGFDRLAGGEQEALAFLLGSREFMRTSPKQGTEVDRLLKGTKRYILSRGYEIESLLYQGWEPHPKEFSTGVAIPEIEWIKRAVVGDAGVWLKIGWYRYLPKTVRYRRFAGHWVTLVGFEGDRLIIHDPAPRSGAPGAHEKVTVERITAGTFEAWRKGPERSAVGFFKLGGDLKIKAGADYGILDGAVALRVRAREARDRASILQSPTIAASSKNNAGTPPK